MTLSRERLDGSEGAMQVSGGGAFPAEGTAHAKGRQYLSGGFCCLPLVTRDSAEGLEQGPCGLTGCDRLALAAGWRMDSREKAGRSSGPYRSGGHDGSGTAVHHILP